MANKVSYKLWITIEKCEVDEKTGEETYSDDEDTRSIGIVDTYSEAIARMNEIGEEYEGDFRVNPF